MKLFDVLVALARVGQIHKQMIQLKLLNYGSITPQLAFIIHLNFIMNITHAGSRYIMPRIGHCDVQA
jgi:hypothetical protein